MDSDEIGLPGLGLEMVKRKVRVKDLATKIGVDPSHLSGVKNGKRPASLGMAKRAAKELACTVDDLLTDPSKGVSANE